MKFAVACLLTGVFCGKVFAMPTVIHGCEVYLEKPQLAKLKSALAEEIGYFVSFWHELASLD